MFQSQTSIIGPANIVGWRALRVLGGRARKRAIIQAPAGGGSLGDQAMLDVICERLARDGMDVMVASQWDGAVPVRSEVSYTFPGQRLWPFRNRADLRALFASHMAFLGADVIDGVYSKSDQKLRLIDTARRVGLKCAALGFSFSDTPAPPAVARLKAMKGVRMHARDARSLVRFETATGLKATLVADMAFLLRPEIRARSAGEAMAWISAARAAGRTIFAVNAGGPGLWSGKTVTLEEVERGLADWMAGDPTRSVLILPHDVRPGKVGDEMATAQIAEALAQFGSDRVHLLRPPFDAWDVKALVGHVDFALTSRMHMAIACLGMGTPPLCMAYQGKFEGLMGHFGIDDMFVRPGAPLLDQITAFESRLPALRDRIAQELPGVKRKAEANFDWFDETAGT